MQGLAVPDAQAVDALLEELAVRLVGGGEPVLEGRRELFEPETELRRLLGGVLKHRFRDPLEAGAGPADLRVDGTGRESRGRPGVFKAF